MQAVTEGRLLWGCTDTAPYLTPAVTQGHPWLRCAFSARGNRSEAGEFNLSYDRGTRPVVERRRATLLRALQLEGSTLHTVRQVHGNGVHVVDAEVDRRGPGGLAGTEGDALVTRVPQAALGVLIADCLPIILYALDTPLVAAVHAGRMGTFHRVASMTLDVIEQRSGVNAARMQALLGPAVGACCYDLDDRAAEPFQEHFRDWQQFIWPSRARQNTGRPWAMSLTAANRLQLLAAGIPQAQIETVSPCTKCHREHFFSHRAEGMGAGRGMAIVGIRRHGEQPSAH